LSGSRELEIPRIQDDHELARKIRGRPEFVGSLAAPAVPFAFVKIVPASNSEANQRFNVRNVLILGPAAAQHDVLKSRVKLTFLVFTQKTQPRSLVKPKFFCTDRTCRCFAQVLIQSRLTNLLLPSGQP